MDKIQVRVLECKEVYDQHNAVNISKWLKETVLNYNIMKTQILSITSDTARNMKAGIKNFMELETSEDDIFDPLEGMLQDEDDLNFIEDSYEVCEIYDFNSSIIIDLNCAAHVVQLAVNSFLVSTPEIILAIKVARQLATKLKRPILSAMLKSQNLPQSILMHQVRWNWTYTCIERLLKLRPFLDNHKNILNELEVSNDIWHMFQRLVETLGPAAILTKHLQAQTLDICNFFTKYYFCKAVLKTHSTDFSLSLLHFIEQRESQLLDNDIVNCGLFLDKRFYFKLNNNKCEKAKKFLKIVQSKALSLQRNDSVNHEEEIILESSGNMSDQFSLLEDVLRDEETFYKHDDSTAPLIYEQLDIEILKYENLPRFKADENIRSWWVANKAEFPLLGNLALIVVSVPLTEVSVERLFSYLSFILDSQRNRLKDDILNDILFVGMNFKLDK